MPPLIGIGTAIPFSSRKGVSDGAAVATFIANYINGTAIPSKGIGTYTFARASAASIVDFEGLVKGTLADEIGFDGQRRVENVMSAVGLETDPRNFSTAFSDLSSITQPSTEVVNGVAVPVYRLNPLSGRATSTGVDQGANQASIAGRSLINNLYVRANVDIRISIGRPVDSSAPAATSIVLAGNTKRIQSDASAWLADFIPFFSVTLTHNTSFFGTGDWVEIYGLQQEETTGQLDNADVSGEFVSDGIQSSPFNGANVDTVKYFPYKNGNSIDASNFITEVAGATIDTPSINKGFQAWEARTNTHEYSENATLGLTSTQGITIADDDAAAPSGEVTADKLTDTGDGITHFAGSTTTTVVDTTNYVFSGYFKPGTATVVQMMGALTGFDNQSFVTFDLSGSGAVDEGTSVVKSGIELMLTGYYHCWFVAPADSDEVGSGMFVALTNNVVDPIRLPSYDASGDALHVWGLGTEAGDFQTPYIKTAGAAAATHVVDNLQHDSDNYADVGWFVAHFSITQDQIDNIANTPMILNISDGAAGEYIRAYIGPADKLIVEVKGSGTAVTATSVAAATPDTEYKIAATWDRGTPTFHVSFDGATVIDETVANTNLMETASAAEYNVGNFESDLDWNGAIAYIEFGKELLDDADLVSKST